MPNKKILDNLIVKQPFEFRRSGWQSSFFIEMTKKQSESLEQQHNLLREQGREASIQLPPHHSLQGGVAGTIGALFAYRNDEAKMRDVYYLAGLVDCLINQVNPILRTAMLRDVFNKVHDLKNRLRVSWSSTLDHVLLPIDTVFFNEMEYRRNLATADTLKALYKTIEDGTQEMFDILSSEYVFYCPHRQT
ncbi:MAG: hypothetical protein DRH12_03000 [Deltaproteobacteria bacterium]|nr:MAG: hypothetical protein DRH12_03000 [Deltaproteobacteria bacterium]